MEEDERKEMAKQTLNKWMGMGMGMGMGRGRRRTKTKFLKFINK